jgi:hypothetical protein
MSIVILVAVPLLTQVDVDLMPGWISAINGIAAANMSVTFVRCAAVRDGDGRALAAATRAAADVVSIPAHADDGPVTMMLARLKLARAALQYGADAIWYVDADIRPRPTTWTRIDELFRAGKPVVVVPYAQHWSAGAPSVFVEVGGRPVQRDARDILPASGEASAVIAGGCFGCTGIITAVACMVPFIVSGISSPQDRGDDMSPRDVGWFVNAHRAGIEVRMPVNHIAERHGAKLSRAG